MEVSSTYNTDSYFANLKGLELANALIEKVRRYYTKLPKTTAWRRYTKALAQYYGIANLDNPFDVTVLGQTGEQGELSSVRVGHVGMIGRHILSLTTASKPAWQPVAVNTDYASVAQTSFCAGLLDYYFRELRIEHVLRKATEIAIIFGLGYYSQPWESKLGDVYAIDADGQPVLRADGDPAPRAYTPLEVAKDLDRNDEMDDWCITRTPVNRWDLVARFAPDSALQNDPDGKLKRLRTAILNKQDDRLPETGGGTRLQSERQLDSGGLRDIVYRYDFYHQKTPACPEGRWAQFLSGDILLGSGPLPYDDLPIFAVAPGYMIGTPYGDSPLHQIAGLQDLIDMLVSAVATNNINCATQNIVMPKDFDIDKNAMSGMTIILTDYGPDGQLIKPEALNLVASAPETYKLIEMLAAVVGRLSGINDVVQGEVPPGAPSGSLMALVQSQAIRYHSALAQSWSEAVARSGNLTLRQLQKFATAPKQALIAGKNKQFMLESFTQKRLENIDRVQVEDANPITKRPEFKVQAGQDLLQRGLIQSADQYFEVIETGRIESMTENPVTEMLNIRKENEMMRQGKVPMLPPFTDHPIHHIHEHRAVLDDPMARADVAVAHAVLAHIQEHMNVWRNADPGTLQALGLPLPPPPQGPPAGAAAGPPGVPPPPPGHPGPPAPPHPHAAPHGGGPIRPPVPPPGAPPAQPTQPKLPMNPATGQQWNSHDGGAPR